jgi:hypothetical protein
VGSVAAQRSIRRSILAGDLERTGDSAANRSFAPHTPPGTAAF